MPKPNIKERLADLEHEQWIHLVSHFASLPPTALREVIYGERYKKLRFTKYENLTEMDKYPDRFFANKVVKLISNKLRGTLSRYEIMRGSTRIKTGDIIKEVFE